MLAGAKTVAPFTHCKSTTSLGGGHTDVEDIPFHAAMHNIFLLCKKVFWQNIGMSVAINVDTNTH